MKQKNSQATNELKPPAGLFDEDKLKMLYDLAEGENDDFLSELAHLFLTELPPMMSKLTEAVSKNDPPTVKKVAHRAKGMCMNIGAKTMAEAFQKLEELGLQGELTGAETWIRREEEAFPSVSRFVSIWAHGPGRDVKE